VRLPACCYSVAKVFWVVAKAFIMIICFRVFSLSFLSMLLCVCFFLWLMLAKIFWVIARVLLCSFYAILGGC